MDGSLLLILAVGLLAVWVILPLVPAVLIYWLFPGTAVAAGGPLAGLTVKASGAFAGYLIVFAATFPVVQRNLDAVDGLKREYWTIQGKIRFVDKKGQDIHWGEYRKNVSMTTNPLTWTIYDSYDDKAKAYDMTLKVLDEGFLPTVTFKVDKFGEGAVNLRTAMTKANVERSRKTIVIEEPIVIRQFVQPPEQATGEDVKPDGRR